MVASVPFELEDLLGEDLGLGCWVMLMQWFKKQMKQMTLYTIERVCVAELLQSSLILCDPMNYI